MKKPDRPNVTGPLAPYAMGFRDDLTRLGYSPWTIPEHLYLLARLSRWLDDQDLGPAELDKARMDEFLAGQRASGRTRWTTSRALIPLMGYLRGIEVTPQETTPAPATAAERLIAAFVDHLSNERGLVAGTIAAYRHFAELFLTTCSPEPASEGCGLERLGPDEINAFVLSECAHRSIGSAKNVVMVLRVLMRFLYLEGYMPNSLVESIPRAIPWRDTGRSRPSLSVLVVRFVSPSEVRRPWVGWCWGSGLVVVGSVCPRGRRGRWW